MLLVCVEEQSLSAITNLEQCMRLLSQLKLAGRQIFASLELTASQVVDYSQQVLASHEQVAVVDLDADSSERVGLEQRLHLELSAGSKSLISHSRKRAGFVVAHGLALVPAVFLSTAYLTTATELLSLPLESLRLGLEELL